MITTANIFVDDSMKLHTVTKRRMYTYTNKDLRVFRFSFQIDHCTLDRLAQFNLLRPKVKRRGCSAGRRKGLNTTKQIGRVDSLIRSTRYVKHRERKINTDNLIFVNSGAKRYIYPNILYTNCRSIRNKFEELCIAISRFDPDLAIFTETWLNGSDTEAYNIDGFSAIHRVRNRSDKNHGGGVSVYVRSGVSVISIKYPEIAELEIITVLLRTKCMQRDVPFIALLAVYSPPVNVFSDLNIDYIMSEIDRIKSINVNADIMLIGDFNDLDIDKRLKEPFYNQLIKQQTCNTNMIDKCFYSGKIRYNVMTTAPIATSDHKLVVLSPVNYVKRDTKCVVTQSRPRKNSCFRSMWSALTNVQWDAVVNNLNYDKAVESFHSLVTSHYEQCFPIVESKKKVNNKPWFDNKIKCAIITRDSHYKNKEVEQFDVLNKQIKKMIQAAKKRQYTKFHKMIVDKRMSFYDVVKSYSNAVEGNREIIFPGMDIESSINMTLSYYSNLLNSHPPLDLECLPAFLPGFPIKPITESFVNNQLKSVKANCSSAPDGIPNFILREFAFELTPPITVLLNRSLLLGYCPKIWKCNYLITIPKKKIMAAPADLRPIVLSSAIIKILERYIYKELLPVLIDKIDVRQFGGLPGRSAENYLTFYLDTVHKNLDIQGNRVTAIITDYSKAFDAVDHNIFMLKLLSMGAPPFMSKWLSSFLYGRTLHLKWNNCLTNKYIHCSNGAPQGSVLGGLIFSVIINNVASIWDNRLKYVDDLTVLCTQPDNVDGHIPQQIVESLKRESNDAKMSLNISKCQFMVHCFSKNPTLFDLRLGTESLSRVKQCKIIGITIQENLKWDAHIGSIITNVNKKLYLLYRLKNVGMGADLLTKAYYTYIRPCMEYCCAIWTTSITKSQIHELERIQKRVLRIILGNDFYTYDDALLKLGLESLTDRRNNLFSKYAMKFLSNYPEFKPETRLSLSGVYTRGASKLCAPRCRTKRYSISPIPKIIEVYNQKI